MAAYLIVIRQSPLRDPAAYAEYQRLNRAAPSPVKMKPLVANGPLQAVEGEEPDAVVVLEFASVDEARAWYDRPGYQEALQHRLGAADYQSFIVEGFAPPTS